VVRVRKRRGSEKHSGHSGYDDQYDIKDGTRDIHHRREDESSEIEDNKIHPNDPVTRAQQ
jgi:hypothetical protein